MASKISDEEKKVFLLSGIAVFTNKVIKTEYADEIRRMIRMTKVGQLFENEKIEYAKEQNLRLLLDMIETRTITEEEAAKSLHCSIEEFQEKKKSLMQSV